MKRHIVTILLLLALIPAAYPQKKPMEIPLYPQNKVPGNLPGPDEEKSESNGGILRVSNIKIPSIRVYLPPADKANGTAVVICPGGGYSIVAIDHEGYKVAEKFNEMGIAAFVLKYRIPNSKNQEDPSIAPLQDAQQAILTVRANAKKWNINRERIGIMGFSAGGHLASTAGTHFERSLVDNPDHISVRPDFMILIYPVISADIAITHSGSFRNLLGSNASDQQLLLYSNEKQVTSNTPPAFLVHASDDGGVSPNNSIVFYQALLKNKIPAELHIYQKGGHGFGMHNATTKDEWMDRCRNWLNANGWLKAQ
jgi:acetyl esterase/lipase